MDNVFVAEGEIVVVDEPMLQKLREAAIASPLKRARLCLHRTNDDPIQEMVIAFARDTYIRPHRHQNKSESFHVLEGTIEVVLFDDSGQVIRRILLGDRRTGLPSIYRVSSDAWHSVLIESDIAVIHETTNGPFIPGATEFALWSPDPNDVSAANQFMTQLRSNPSADNPRDSISVGTPSNSIISNAWKRPTVPKHSPSLTAIICNYNHGKTIDRAIEAIVNQSRPADEFIIVDDGSTDDSVARIQSWLRRFPDIRFLKNEKNLGFHASFQRALSDATCDFIYSGAADDRILPGFFEGTMQLAEKHPESGILFGQFVTVDPTGRHLRTNTLSNVHQAKWLEPATYMNEVLRSEPATQSLSAATIFRRQPLMDLGGFRADLGSWADTFTLQVLALRHGASHWPHPAMEWTIMPGAMSNLTRSNPQKAWQIVDRAVELMQSDEFKQLFPIDYVKSWSAGFRQAIAHEQLSDAIEGNQQLQSCIKSTASTASFPFGAILKTLGFMQRCLYFVTFRAMRVVVTRRLASGAEKSAK